jgi:uncharacterized protein (DUF927 family)
MESMESQTQHVILQGDDSLLLKFLEEGKAGNPSQEDLALYLAETFGSCGMTRHGITPQEFPVGLLEDAKSASSLRALLRYIRDHRSNEFPAAKYYALNSAPLYNYLMGEAEEDVTPAMIKEKLEAEFRAIDLKVQRLLSQMAERNSHVEVSDREAYVTVFYSPRPVGKKVWLSPDGAVQRDHGVFTSGTFYLWYLNDLREVAYLLSAPPKMEKGKFSYRGNPVTNRCAISSSLPLPGLTGREGRMPREGRIETEQALKTLALSNNEAFDKACLLHEGQYIIPRSKKSFGLVAGQAGILILDYDPPKEGKALSRDELWQAIRKACPAIEGAVWTPSSSSNIWQGDKEVSGLKGQRLYLLIRDLGDSKRFLETLFNRLWLQGYGYMMVDAAGRLHSRTLVDRAMTHTAHLDYAGGAILGDGLSQDRPVEILGNASSSLLDTRQASPDLTGEEKKRLAEITRKAKGELEAEARERSASFLKRHTVGEGNPCNVDLENKVLLGDYTITLREGKKVKVSDILENPKAFHEQVTLDPIEPDYDGGRFVGKLYTAQDTPSLYSFAHGGEMWLLQDNTNGTQEEGPFKITPKGVFCIEGGKQHFLCAPLHIVAMTRDAKSNAWGRLLHWKDGDGVSHEWAMPLEMLHGDSAEVWRELAHQGLKFALGRSAKARLAAYLQNWPVEKHVRCVGQLGWHGAVYVTPTKTIGADELVVFQNTQSIAPAFAVSGASEEWRDSVAMLAAGNSRLVFALSVAFAGTLLHLVGEDSGGFHLRGESSSGKSTALKLAASVWGSPGAYPRLWRATANGLEGLAALHNDGLLILDELSQIDPREAGEASYMLANGQGKSRASKTGAARESAKWRLLFLSAGEAPLSALMAQANKRTNAGQEIRMTDIASDAGAGMGAFENIHDYPSPSAFAQGLNDAALKYHGAVGMAWLRCIVPDARDLTEALRARIAGFVKEVTPASPGGQVARVAKRFALVAAAGELATGYGLTGWQEGEASAAVKKCFTAWLEGFGGAGNKEERAILSQVRAFFEAHGSSRFENLHSISDQRIPNRVGYVRDLAVGKEYLVSPEMFKQEVCAGLDVKAATAILAEKGWIERGHGGKFSQSIRLPNLPPQRFYVFTGRLWADSTWEGQV